MSLQQFRDEVTISDKNIQDFVSFAAERNVTVRVRNYKKELKQYIKAVMAQQLFNTDVFEQMLNEGNPMIEKVISLSRK